MSWTTELAAAETLETANRSKRIAGLPSYMRWDGRGAQLMMEWIAARAAVSPLAAPGSDKAYWANVAARAVTAMGPSWGVVTSFMGATEEGWSLPSTPYAGHVTNLDGLFEGLVKAWANSAWTTSGRALPHAGYWRDETWTNLFAHVLQSAGPT